MSGGAIKPHVEGLLRVGRAGAIVSDGPSVDALSGSDHTEYYGGHLVAESMTEANARRAVACWNACDSVPTEMLEQVGAIIVKGGIPYRLLVAQRDELHEALRILALNVQSASDEMPNDITDKATRILKCAPQVWPGMKLALAALKRVALGV